MAQQKKVLKKYSTAGQACNKFSGKHLVASNKGAISYCLNQIADAELANKYLKQLAQHHDEVRITVEPNSVSSPAEKNNGESSARTNDNRQGKIKLPH